MSYRIAVVGATGNVGREMLNTLYDRNFPVSDIYAVASKRSVGKEVFFGDKALKVEALDNFDFSKVDIVIASAGGKVSEEFAPRAAAAGAIVIDNSSAWRMDKDVPLIVPEVNPEALAGYNKKNIIANPNCSTIQMVVALKPLHDIAKIKRVVVSTYQSVSGSGKAAMDELFNQTKALFSNGEMRNEVYAKQIAFNVIPQIDVFMDTGSTKEEWKMIMETKKILDKELEVSATVVRFPVFISHSEAVNVEFEEFLSAEDARKALQHAPGVLVVDKLDPEEGFVTPIEISGDDSVYVGRIRQDTSIDNGLDMWVVADNLRKGAALNAVQIAELLIEKYLKK